MAGRDRPFLLVILPLLMLGAALAWSIAIKTDREMRADLLLEAQLLARTVNLERVSDLTGTAADADNPVYLRLRNQLATIRPSDPRGGSVHLLGRNGAGTLLFDVGSEPADSRDYSPPGQIKDESAASYRLALATHSATNSAPFTARRGTWISALVPLQPRATFVHDLATPVEAQAMAREAVEFYRKHGRKALFTEINNPQGAFCQGDLYVFAYDRSMTVLAHPVKPELIGKNLLDKKDRAEGKYFSKEIQHVARTHGTGWVDYEYENPATGRIEPKTTYVESADDLIICAGAYKGLPAVYGTLVMNVDAREWYFRLALAALPAVVLTLMLTAVLLTGRVILNRRSRALGEQSHLTPGFATTLIVAVGLLLTMFGVWTSSTFESRGRRAVFARLAASRAEAIARTLHTLRDTELEGLAHLFAADEEVTPWQFRQFAAHLIRNSTVAAWEWIPVVPVADKARFETATPLSGTPIWQKGAQGQRLPATERELYYPVSMVSPLAGNGCAVGYDLGSEPLRRAAIEEAAHTGLVTGTEPLILVQDSGTESGMLVLRPVFADRPPQQLRGFVSAVLRMETLLQSAGPDATVLLSLACLHTDAAPKPLAVSWTAKSPPDGEDGVSIPVFAFGKSFAVTAYAGPDFQHAQPRQTGAFVFLAGLALTAMIAGLSHATLRRREDLERLVIERTSALTASEQSYRDQFARNAAVMLLVDAADGTLLAANDAALRFYGYPREHLLALRISDLNLTSQAVDRPALTFASAEEGSRTDVQQRLADGSVRDVEISSSCIVTSGGVILHAIITDNTERTLAEAALKRQSSLITSLLDSIPDLIFFKDTESVYLGCNPSFAAFVGKSRAEIVGSNDDDLFGHEIGDMFRHHDKEMLKQRLPRHNEEWITYPDGRRVLLDTLKTPYWDADGVLIGIIGVSRDITERDAARQDRENATLRLELATRAGGVGVWDLDLIENVLVWDDQMFALYGTERKDFPGAYEAWVACVHPDDMARSDAEIRMAISGERNFDTEFRVVCTDGSIRNVRAIAVVQRDETGKPVRMIGTSWDITAAKRSEALLLDANHYLEEAILAAELANRAKSEFLANMSHELRTPMNGVIGINNLLLDTELTDEQRRYATTVQTSGESLLMLLNDILDYSKMEAGKLDLETLDFDLRATLDDFAALQSLRAHEKGLEFICSAAAEVPSFVRGDPGRLRQILVNLAANAIKFTHQGEVAVRAALVSETDTETVVRFSIRDTGIGIPADKQHVLFRKFSQVDSTVTRKFGGTGLGLAISRQLAELMGGTIGLSSPLPASDGGGTEFWFTARLGKQAQAAAVAVPAADVRGLRFLVVDDNATSREVLLTQLTAWGLDADEAGDGPTALSALHAARKAGTPFAGALLDLQMPGMDGEELARAIKRDDTLGDIRLILMTPLAQKVEARRLAEIGVGACLTKPVRVSDLRDCLASLRHGADQSQSPLPAVSRPSVRTLREHTVRILIAEDNVVNQHVARGILKKLGLHADAVANGAEAIAALEMIPYDLVLMDCMMPEMDGYEATRQIRSQRSGVLNHDIPVIAMTANAMLGDRQLCLEAGMNDYVSKPVDAKALAAALDRWLPPDSSCAAPPVPSLSA